VKQEKRASLSEDMDFIYHSIIRSSNRSLYVDRKKSFFFC